MSRPKVSAPPAKKTVTPDTRFQIDYDWWEQGNLDLKTYLYTRLQIGDEAMLESGEDQVDLVDSHTGEVARVDGFQYVLQTYFSQLPDDFAQRASLVDAVFCVLLGNANQPMTARDIAARIGRGVDVVVKTLGGPSIYQGIRPLLEDND